MSQLWLAESLYIHTCLSGRWSVDVFIILPYVRDHVCPPTHWVSVAAADLREFLFIWMCFPCSRVYTKINFHRKYIA